MKQWLKSTLLSAAWAPMTVFVFYAIAAKGFGAYLIWPNLDIPTHFLGGAAIAYFFLAAIGHGQRMVGAIPSSVQALLGVGTTAVVAVVWEFLEFASDALLGTAMNLGVQDTLSDLFFGLAGALVVVGGGYRFIQELPSSANVGSGPK